MSDYSEYSESSESSVSSESGHSYGLQNDLLNDTSDNDSDNTSSDDNSDEYFASVSSPIDSINNSSQVENILSDERLDNLTNKIEHKRLFRNTKSCDKSLIQNYRITKFNEYHIHKSLYKLRHPVKLEHYDTVVNLLRNTDPYQKTNDKIIVYGKNQETIAIVHALKIDNNPDTLDNIDNPNNPNNPNNPKSKLQIRSKPSRWIRFYSQNICAKDKQDVNHMFPFVLDWLLMNWTCIERRTRDKMHPDGQDVLIYFYGELLIDGVMVEGCFEYFLNSNNSIFHRLFRENYKLPSKIQEILPKIH